MDEPLQAGEQAIIWSAAPLHNLNLLRATFITYAFKRHLHDYFVIGMVEAGMQQFDLQREHYVTPPTGLIVINPGAAHTGAAATPEGFGYRALYPEADVLQQIAAEIRERWRGIPVFTEPVIHDPPLFAEFHSLHRALEQDRPTLEFESRYLRALAHLILRHADPRPSAAPLHREKAEVRRLRQYIDERCADDITLDDLARLVNWSPFYLLRVFRREVGLPPHAYLETIRIQRAQQLIGQGVPLIEVAYATGFSSQSHFTTTFKRLIGVTPGQYARARF